MSEIKKLHREMFDETEILEEATGLRRVDSQLTRQNKLINDKDDINT